MALEHCIICLSPTTSITSCYARYALSLALFKVQFVCLQVALEQGTISLSVATELFKTARLTKAESTKDATLANDPCTENEDDYTFTVANYNDTATTSARERYLGLTNRVIAGMLLQTTRTTPVNCTDSRFSDIESLCKGGQPKSFSQHVRLDMRLQPVSPSSPACD